MNCHVNDAKRSLENHFHINKVVANAVQLFRKPLSYICYFIFCITSNNKWKNFGRSKFWIEVNIFAIKSHSWVWKFINFYKKDKLNQHLYYLEDSTVVCFGVARDFNIPRRKCLHIGIHPVLLELLLNFL